ncbi:MAG TPA: hypothetical protein VD859_12860 [Nocardioides sp.]|nr:hypothetical protein [Nocardioides sp.]
MKYAGRGAALLAVALLATACTEDAEPVFPEEPVASAVSTEYDPSLEPSAAVLPLVPEEATTLTVTDFEQLRLTLGFGTFDGSTDAADRARFWNTVGSAVSLSDGLLRPVDARLRADFGFGQDDVSWEARYGGDAEGWVLAFRDGLPMTGVQRAVQAGVGPLAGAVLDPERRLVTSAAAPDGDASWAADLEVVALVGAQANATYVERGCVPFDTVFGKGMEEQLAETPAAALGALEPLEGYAVAFGSDLVTVQLGPERTDAFERLRIDQVMPQLEPEFGSVFARGVADPSTGRLGYNLVKADVATRWTLERRLPFAVCAG